MGATVLLTLDAPGYLRISTSGWLGGGDRFQEFLAAIEGARYDRARKANVAPIDKVPQILVRLRDAGFEVRPPDREVVAALQGRHITNWLDLKAAQERIDAIDAELHRRTGHRLFPYQRTGVQWLSYRYAALLGDDPGTGKTLQTIAAFPGSVPMLVVGPAAAKGEWLAEMERWRPGIPVRMLAGRGSFRWPEKGELVLTNYDILPDNHDRTVACPGCGATYGPDAEAFKDLDLLMKKDAADPRSVETRACASCRGRVPLRPRCDGRAPAKPCRGCHEEVEFTATEVRTVVRGHDAGCTGFEPDRDRARCPGCHPILKTIPRDIVVVYDEVHLCKNPESLRTQRVRSIGAGARDVGGRTWGLSGTPLENEPPELWTVLSILGLAEECFGKYGAFVTLMGGVEKEIYIRGEGKRRAGYEWGAASPEVPERLRRGMLRRSKADVLPDLPPKLHKRVYVDVDARAIRACDAFLKSAGGVDKIAELLQADKLTFETFSKVGTALAAAKIPRLVEFVEEYESRGEPIVVFSMHRAPLDFIAKRKGWKAITGDVEAGPVRRALVEEFQAGKLRGLACSIQATGVAVTLTRASTCLFVDRSFKPGQNIQAEDRLQRIGAAGNAEGNILVILLEAQHVLERRMQEVLDRKTRIIRGSVEAASVGDDAPPCTNLDFEGDLKRMRTEIALGRAVRRAAETEEERAHLETLSTCSFPRVEQDRLAQRLLMEAGLVGLSDAQWTLAGNLAGEGVPTRKVVL